MQLSELADRARENKLKLEDVQGGTFTISNLGMFGILHFRAVINPPESAILAVGSVVRKPVVVDDQDRVEVRPMLSLTLSAAHRVIDGVVAARFLSELVTGLESPSLLLF
jgi:pyruvate dehydrogenase E2 component (dihydrolipoamide acetyltransferase)